MFIHVSRRPGRLASAYYKAVPTHPGSLLAPRCSSTLTSSHTVIERDIIALRHTIRANLSKETLQPRVSLPILIRGYIFLNALAERLAGYVMDARRPRLIPAPVTLETRAFHKVAASSRLTGSDLRHEESLDRFDKVCFTSAKCRHPSSERLFLHFIVAWTCRQGKARNARSLHQHTGI